MFNKVTSALKNTAESAGSASSKLKRITEQRTLETLGKAKPTRDEEFQALLTFILTLEKNVEIVFTETKNYIAALSRLSRVSQSLASASTSLLTPHVQPSSPTSTSPTSIAPPSSGTTAYNLAYKMAEAKAAEISAHDPEKPGTPEQVRRTVVLDNLKKWQEYFRKARARVSELEDLRAEYDHYKRKADNLTQNDKLEHQAKVQEKLNSARAMYELKMAELKKEFGIIRDRAADVFASSFSSIYLLEHAYAERIVNNSSRKDLESLSQTQLFLPDSLLSS